MARELGTDGTWVVKTRSAAYLLDLDEKLAVRKPNSEPEENYQSADLRKDGEAWQVEEVVTCEVGSPMKVYASGINDDPQVKTLRLTTPVISIEKVSERRASQQ